MKLPYCEIMELETQLGSDIWIWLLFLWQSDVHADGFRSHLVRPAIGRFHNARSAAGDHYVITAIGRLAIGGNQPGEMVCSLIVMAEFGDFFCPGNCPLTSHVVGRIDQQCPRTLQLLLCNVRLDDPRTAKYYDRRSYIVPLKI